MLDVSTILPHNLVKGSTVDSKQLRPAIYCRSLYIKSSLTPLLFISIVNIHHEH